MRSCDLLHGHLLASRPVTDVFDIDVQRISKGADDSIIVEEMAIEPRIANQVAERRLAMGFAKIIQHGAEFKRIATKLGIRIDRVSEIAREQQVNCGRSRDFRQGGKGIHGINPSADQLLEEVDILGGIEQAEIAWIEMLPGVQQLILDLQGSPAGGTQVVRSRLRFHVSGDHAPVRSDRFRSRTHA